MIYGYARVSSLGQTLEVQSELLKTSGCEVIYSEKFTGTTSDRVELQNLLRALKSGDTLVVTKICRVARNTRAGLEIIEELINKGVTIKILNMGTFDNTPTGKLSLTMFMAFAQFERDMIVERTQEGKAHAKANDPEYREGRKKTYKKATIARAIELKESGATYRMIEDETGMSKATVWREWTKYQKEKGL